MPESNDRRHSAETSPLAAPGEVKIDVCRRLGDGWPDLADYIQIPSHERRQFRQGFEAQAIWEWLDSRARLRELLEALRCIGRSDLADLWVETQRQLDALNEMPHSGDEPIRLWKDFLQMLGRDYPHNRVIFSCRSLDYSASLSSKEWPVPQVRIEPLSDAQVQQFVELYCPEHAETL